MIRHVAASFVMLGSMKRVPILALAALFASSGCTQRADLEKVPIGAEVAVTRQDGGVVRGTLAARDDSTVKVTVDSVERTIPRNQITGMQVVDAAPSASPATAPEPVAEAPVVAPPPAFNDVTLPQGMKMSVRLDSPVGSDSSRVGDPVGATLTRALVLDGVEVIPSGSLLTGEVSAVRASAKVKGRASLALRFSSISLPGQDGSYPIAAHVSFLAPATKRNDAAKIGIPAAGGAIIGGLMGGKKGAAIGTAIGGGGGTAVVLSTAGRQVRLERGRELSLRLERESSIRIPIGAQ